MSMDMVIRNGNIVTADANYTADIGVRGGVIAQIGGAMDGGREIDASGKLVTPGGVDVHVHFEPDEELGPDWRGMVDGYYEGSAGAAIGGITTFGNMVAPLGDEGEGNGEEGLLEMLNRSEASALANSVLDFTLHPYHLPPHPRENRRNPPIWPSNGYFSIKIFTLFQFDRRVKDFIRAIDASSRARHDHHDALRGPAFEWLTWPDASSAKESPAIQYYNDSRPDYAEAIATARAVAIGRATGRQHLCGPLVLESSAWTSPVSNAAVGTAGLRRDPAHLPSPG